MRYLFLILTLITVPVFAQLTGTWNGTYALTHTTCPGTFNGPAALYARQSDGAFTAVLDIDAVSNETCSVTGLPLALAISGSVSGNTVSALIFGPFEHQSAPFDGAISGNTMTASFGDTGTSVTLALTRSTSEPPASTITGTYSGTYSIADDLSRDPCLNIPLLSYTGPLTAAMLQGGPLVTGIFELREVKDTDHDQSGNCTVIEGEVEKVGMMGRISGNSIFGVIFSEETFPLNATVSGETMTGTGGGGGMSFTISMTRTSTALVPSVLEFEADPSTIRAGESTTLRWTVFNANSVTIDHGVGTKPAAGTASVSPESTTTYTLTAISSTGTTAAAQTTVTVTHAPRRRRAVRH